MATVGALVGWKFRAALVLGHVKAVEGDTLRITPVSKPESEVKRKREKVLLESEMDRDDVEEAMKRHGHMARTATKSRGAKAQAIGLGAPSQMMPEGEARAAKRSREGEYKREAAARKAPKAAARGGHKAGAKTVSPEAEAEEEEEEAPPTPTPNKKARSRAAAKPAPKRGKKATAKAA